MSEFAARVVRVNGFGKHPNADTLSITNAMGETVIFKTGDFQKGDLAVYVPVDAVVPNTVPGTEFLDQSKRRVKAKRLRGVYSEGLLLPLTCIPDKSLSVEQMLNFEGADVTTALGITKHEDPIPPHLAGEAQRDPGVVPHYDIESFKRNSHLLVEGERVIVTEKLHGTNSRFCYLDGLDERRMYVGSRNMFWKDDDKHPNLYWTMAKKYDLVEKLSRPGYWGLALYGEIYGQVQDLKYGAKPGECWLRIFDIYDTDQRRWLDWDDVVLACRYLGLDTVPVLYDGPYSRSTLEGLVEGKSALADNIREGVVVKPAVTRIDPTFGRVILKWVSESYKLRKNGTELH